MKPRALLLLLGAALAAVGPASWAAVTVRFVDPQRFVDASMEGYGEPPEANRALVEIRGHLLALGARCIPQDQSLTILVRELDLGGRYEWQRRASTGNFRVLRDVVWSRMTLEYVWQGSDGSVLGASIDRLDQAVFLGSDARRSRSDVALPDEKAMLTEWFEARFCRDDQASSRKLQSPR